MFQFQLPGLTRENRGTFLRAVEAAVEAVDKEHHVLSDTLRECWKVSAQPRDSGLGQDKF